jgi:hypothetical protein
VRLAKLAAICALLCGLALSWAGCVQVPPGDLLCADPSPCDCPATGDYGAVVVRWRVSDGQVGQLLDRGECCCMPYDAPLSAISGQQCQNFGISCPKTPAWLIRQVQLRITPAEGGATCIIARPCIDAELTTEYCIKPGMYDLQVTADVDVLSCSSAGAEFVCANRQAISPPSVRRRIIGGQAVSLDGIVLGVNPPPIAGAPSVGSDPTRCSATADGGTHE